MGSLRRPPRFRAVLQHLADSTGHTAYLACISAGRLVIVDLAEGARSPWLEDLQPGLEAAAHATAVGKAQLTALPGRGRASLLAGLQAAAADLSASTRPAAQFCSGISSAANESRN